VRSVPDRVNGQFTVMKIEMANKITKCCEGRAFVPAPARSNPRTVSDDYPAVDYFAGRQQDQSRGRWDFLRWHRPAMEVT